MTFLSFTCLEIISRISYSITFARDEGKADWTVVALVLVLVMFEGRSDLCILPVLRHLLQLPRLFKDYGEWPQNDISHLPQNSTNLLGIDIKLICKKLVANALF